MVPHVLGYFPCIAAWVCIICQFELAIEDLKPITERRPPIWVSASMYGTFLIFLAFAAVQAIFQGETSI